MMWAIHLHVTLWTLLLILFVVNIGLLRSGKLKGQKIVHMILRLFYILVLLSGLHLLGALYQFASLNAILKGVFGILVIGGMEMVLVRSKKGKRTVVAWSLFAAALVLVFYYGYVVLSY
ncbi:DUF1516 family protein [Metabacillus iocasae]|uniref:Uncharacterized protein n=1 Tax=Priestia iocasae TaxID=2291674 RepID=A0ABS2QT37_9BACI|nr:DUF1516 family protein [Metabacillus iocasae]MBM7702630.1 hypothetical protein [Metabacillus iocasae]